MENKPRYTAEYSMDYGMEKIIADSVDEFIERLKQFQCQHPNANFKVGALVGWISIEKVNG